MDKKTMVLIGIGAVIILVMGIFFLSGKKEKKEQPENNNNNQVIVDNNENEEIEEEPEIIIPSEDENEEGRDEPTNPDEPTEDEKEDDEDKNVGNYTLKIYEDQNGNYSLEKKNVNDKIAALINVKNEDAKLHDFSTTSEKNGNLNYVLYYDSTLKLYDVATGTITKFDFNYDTYKLQMSYDRKIVQGLIYSYIEKQESEVETPESENPSNDSTNVETQEPINPQAKPIYGYYNLTTQKNLYENKYEELHSIDGDFIYGTIKTTDKEDKDCANEICERNYHLLSVTKEMPLWINKGIYNSIETRKNENDYFIIFGYTNNESTISKVYSSRRNEIIEGLEYEDYTFDKENYLYTRINDKVYKYNVNGDLEEESESYQKIINIINNYIIYVENDIIYLTDFEGSFIEELADYEDYNIYKLYELNNKEYQNHLCFELEKNSSEDEEDSEDDEEETEKEITYIYYDIENNELIKDN